MGNSGGEKKCPVCECPQSSAHLINKQECEKLSQEVDLAKRNTIGNQVYYFFYY